MPCIQYLVISHSDVRCEVYFDIVIICLLGRKSKYCFDKSKLKGWINYSALFCFHSETVMYYSDEYKELANKMLITSD